MSPGADVRRSWGRRLMYLLRLRPGPPFPRPSRSTVASRRPAPTPPLTSPGRHRGPRPWKPLRGLPVGHPRDTGRRFEMPPAWQGFVRDPLLRFFRNPTTPSPSSPTGRPTSDRQHASWKSGRSGFRRRLGPPKRCHRAAFRWPLPWRFVRAGPRGSWRPCQPRFVATRRTAPALLLNPSAAYAYELAGRSPRARKNTEHAFAGQLPNWPTATKPSLHVVIVRGRRALAGRPPYYLATTPSVDHDVGGGGSSDYPSRPAYRPRQNTTIIRGAIYVHPGAGPPSTSNSLEMYQGPRGGDRRLRFLHQTRVSSGRPHRDGRCLHPNGRAALNEHPPCPARRP